MHMKTRSLDPAMAIIKEMEKMYLPGTSGKIEHVLTEIEKKGMGGLEFIDMFCVMPGWLAAYEKKLGQLTKANNGMADAAIDAVAVRFADQVMRDTQPSSRAVDMAPLLRDQKGPMAGILLQFQVPMSVIFQNIAFDMPANMRQGKILEGLTTIGIYALTAAALGLMAEPDDEDKLNPKYRAIDALTGLFESIPVVGGGLGYNMESFFRTGKIKPRFDSWFPVSDSGVAAINALSDEDWGKAVSNVVDMFGYFTGLPIGLKRELQKAFTEEELNEIILRGMAGWR
jgi:hypothetical protein